MAPQNQGEEGAGRVPSALAASLPKEHLSCGLGGCPLQGRELRARTQAVLSGKENRGGGFREAASLLAPSWLAWRSGWWVSELGRKPGSAANLRAKGGRGAVLYVKAMLVLGSSITNHIFLLTFQFLEM